MYNECQNYSPIVFYVFNRKKESEEIEDKDLCMQTPDKIYSIILTFTVNKATNTGTTIKNEEERKDKV